MASSNEEEDRISRLPRDIIESILERLPLQDAIRTSVLSTNWRYNWVSIKKMNFDENFSDSLENKSDHPRIFHDVMVQHVGSIESFSLCSLYGSPHPIYTTGLAIAATKGVKDLTLETCELLTHLYSFSQLTHLKLVWTQFIRPPPPTFTGFRSLIKLHFHQVNFFHGSFEILMSGCPLLEVLIMYNCGPTLGGPLKFHICSATLKHLEVSAQRGPTFHIDAKNLETLYFKPPRSECSPVVAAPLNFLKKLDFSCHLSQLKDEALLLFFLIQGAPNLQELEIRTSLRLKTESMEQAMKSSEGSKNKMLDKLQFVKIISFGDPKHKLFILKFLLAQSPSLKKMVFDKALRLGTTRYRKNFRTKLMGFPRASPRARIILK